MKIIIKKTVTETTVNTRQKRLPSNRHIIKNRCAMELRRSVLSKKDVKLVRDIMSTHCNSHCQMVYGKGHCLKMDCYKVMQKLEGELDEL